MGWQYHNFKRSTCGFEALSGGMSFSCGTSTRYVSDTHSVVRGTSSGSKAAFGRFRNDMDFCLSLDDTITNAVTEPFERSSAMWTAPTGGVVSTRVQSVCTALGNVAWSQQMTASERGHKVALPESTFPGGVVSLWVKDDGHTVRTLFERSGGFFGSLADEFGTAGPPNVGNWRRKYLIGVDNSGGDFINLWPAVGFATEDESVLTNIACEEDTDWVCAAPLVAEPSVGTVSHGVLSHSSTPMVGGRADMWIRCQPKNHPVMLGEVYLMYVNGNNCVIHDFTTSVTTVRINGVDWFCHNSEIHNALSGANGTISHMSTVDIHIAYGGSQQSVFQVICDGIPRKEYVSGSPQVAHSSAYSISFLGYHTAGKTLGSYVHSIKFKV